MVKVLMTSVAAVALLIGQAQAQEKLKIGVVTTLSGPAAVLGQQLRNGLQLAIKNSDGKLGGREVQLIVEDDELKPDVAVSKAKALIDRDKVDFVVGPIFSHILVAIMKPVTDGGAILISPNAGTSNFAGKDCNANFFVTSYQNDQNHEVMGKYAQDAGMKKVFIMAPNYPAGKDSLAGFKRFFKGELADEVYVPLGQLDYSAELSKIAAASPDAVFVFLPGGMGVNFVKQFRQAGLADKVIQRGAGDLRLPVLRRGAADRWRAEGDQRQHGRQGRAARGHDEGAVHLAARRFQVQHQPLSDPGLLPGEGGSARRRQVSDRNRQEGLCELRRSVRQGLPDEVRAFPLPACREREKHRSR